MNISPKPNTVKRLLTREVEAVHFSDGDMFFVGKKAIPEKPQGVVSERLRVRVWWWRRV